MSYTVKIIDGKPWVVEVALEPIELKYGDLKQGEEAYYQSLYDERLRDANKYPTLPEHAAHWQALEGKEFDEGSFEVKDLETDDIIGEIQCPGGDKYPKFHSQLTAIPIPQPNEDEVWDDLNDWLYDRLDDVAKHRIDNVVHSMKSKFTLSKK